MKVLTRHANNLSKLTPQLLATDEARNIKNRDARLRRPAAICRPTKIKQIQQCVQWALEHKTGLTIISRGHSGHCIWDNIVLVNIRAFNQVIVHTTEEADLSVELSCNALVVAEAGCTTRDIIENAIAAGVIVPLGSRPSVGAGLWLQGGICHLAQMHSLACDAIVGAVVVSVDSSQVLCVRHVPSQHQPAGSVRLENEATIL
jgi:FAD/FMN-containing dehydrogenase